MFPITLSVVLKNENELYDFLRKTFSTYNSNVVGDDEGIKVKPNASATAVAEPEAIKQASVPPPPPKKGSGAVEKVKAAAPAEAAAPAKSGEGEYDLPAEWFADPTTRAFRVTEALAKGQTFAPMKPVIALDMVAAALIKLSTTQGRPVAEALLAKFNAKKLTQVPPEQFREVLMEIKTLMEEAK